jgi:hypothetical protein
MRFSESPGPLRITLKSYGPRVIILTISKIEREPTMNMNDTNAQPTDALSSEDYNQAMNYIGQNLLSSLVKITDNLPAPLRNKDVVMQGLAAFLSNVVCKQCPQDREARQLMLAQLSKLVGMHLENIA